MSRGKQIHVPPVIPVRFADEAELAATARNLEIIRLARALADWFGDTPADVATAWKNADAIMEAAEALGLVTPDEYRAPSREIIAGAPADEVFAKLLSQSGQLFSRLQWIYEVALQAGYLHLHGGQVHRRPGLTETTVLADRDMLSGWSDALEVLFGRGVEEAVGDLALHHGTGSLDFDGIGIFPVYQLLEGYGAATIAELSETIAFGATEGLSAAAGKRAWDAWTAEHGDPTLGFLRLAEDLGVLTIDGDVVELTPLGTWDTLRSLSGIKLEHLPPSAELTGDQVLICCLGMREAAFGRELEGWLAARSPGDAVTEILAAGAADGRGSLFLTSAVVIARGIDGETDAAWRDALGIPAVRPYAVEELNRRVGRDPATDPLPDAEPAPSDQLVMSAHTIMASYEKTSDPERLAEAVREAADGYGSEVALFDQLWRSRQSAALAALKGIGTTHPDKKTAKAARAAARKASTAR